MDRPELATDVRFDRMTKRVALMEEVDAIVSAFSRLQSKQSLFELLIAHRVPSAPVRELQEVIADQALHKRGALFDIDHPAYGKLTVSGSPLRFTDVDQLPYTPVPAYGADNNDIYGRLGLDLAQIKALAEAQVI
jgi:formyl-CoA transferase